MLVGFENVDDWALAAFSNFEKHWETMPASPASVHGIGGSDFGFINAAYAGILIHRQGATAATRLIGR